MKINKIFLPIIACTLTLGSCDDNKMEWGQPEGQENVTIADIPLELQEKIANYQSIKAYAQQYTPNMTIGLGIGADYYMNSETVKALSDENFQMYTLGNAMKHSSVVQNNGNLNFGTIDAFLAAIPSDMKVYGHNFIWHTQQKQNYLKSLIAPEVVVEADPSGIASILTNGDFEDGTTNPWGCWGNNSPSKEISAEGEGHNSKYSMKLTNPEDGGEYQEWKAQCAYTFDTPLDPSKKYTIQFYAKASNAGTVQFQYQNGTTYGSQGGYSRFEIGTDWMLCEAEITVEYDDANRILLNFGAFGGTYWIDDIKFGEKVEGPTNYCTNGSFEDGTTEWTINNASAGVESVALDDAIEGKNALKMTASADAANAWDLQVTSPTMPTMPGKKVQLSFYVKSDQAGKGRVSFSSDMSNQWPWMNWTGSQDSWTEAFETSTSWTYVNVVLQNFSCDFNEGASTWSFNLDFGYLPGVTYYIDDVKVIEYVEEQPAARAASRAAMTYIYKTPEEKRELLLGAMESWIKGMAEHVGNRVMEWDVINEPIADGSNGWRGIDNVFGGSDGDGNQDLAPVEEIGLNLNWASDHFYWGYYLGMEYATKAFEYARQYCAPGSKLYVNDYNLETSPKKLESLINFIKYIDENNATGAPIVDGIGTQMHVVSNITKAEVDAMFKTMAATGKLIRVTELDVRIGYEATANPSAEQLQTQAEVYRMIIESYKANVPEAQQSGITIWGLSDHPDEHTYWYTGDTPNIFDANYARKHAYKGVCDGIAGKDVSEEFSGDDWGAAYE